MTADRRGLYRPGLDVSLGAWPEDHAGARYLVQASVAEGRLPLTLHFYVDGDLLDTVVGGSPVQEFVTDGLAYGRHVVTVRALDATGRWGGASAVVECAAAFRAHAADCAGWPRRTPTLALAR